MQEILILRYENIIDAPLQLVVDCINEDKHVQEWHSFFIENVYEEENAQIGLGTKYISRQQLGKNKIEDIPCEITEYEKNRLYTITATTKEGTNITRYLFDETEDGTELTIEIYLKPRNWYYKVKSILTKKLVKFVYEDEFENCEEYIYDQLEQLEQHGA